jgi:mRNA-degrading endonuclease RelE of RelBE toxin-antitoxin system
LRINHLEPRLLHRRREEVRQNPAFDLQLDPTSPGMQFHKLDRIRDPNFWSIRVSREIRLIVHCTASSLLLCSVAHHDRAYAWAERRKLEIHPTTGAGQLAGVGVSQGFGSELTDITLAACRNELFRSADQ